MPNIVKGQLGRRKLPGQIWQMDYIRPLPQDRGCKSICTAADTYSGYLIAHPSKKATHHSTICTIDTIILYYGIPLQIQTDNGSHFPNKFVQRYTEQQNTQWVFHISYYPQPVGLIERVNGLLREQFKKVGDGNLSPWRARLTDT